MITMVKVKKEMAKNIKKKTLRQDPLRLFLVIFGRRA